MQPKYLMFAASLAAAPCCTKQSPSTTYVEFRDSEVDVLRGRPTERVETEPAEAEELKGPVPEARALTGATLLAALTPASSPPLWKCFAATLQNGADVGECWVSINACRERRDAWKATGASTTNCATQPRAACFYVEFPLHEFAGYVCFESFRACNHVRDFHLSNPDSRNVGTQCEARRIADAQ